MSNDSSYQFSRSRSRETLGTCTNAQTLTDQPAVGAPATITTRRTPNWEVLKHFFLFVGMAALLIRTDRAGADQSLPQQTQLALRNAVEFFHNEVAAHGGYVYRYSADLSKREGEGKTTRDTVWVQPPGTPAVGMAYLDAYRRTGEAYLLEAARATGECLVRGQLRSGGWSNSIEFDPETRPRHAYRVDTVREPARNRTTFDDDKSQSAMRMLIRLDQALEFKDERVHEASMFALESVLKAQFPNGAWPQGFTEFPDPAKYPVQRASFPASWPREHPGGDYWVFYTFNDNTIADTVDMLFLASEVYGESRYRTAALRGGEFMLLAQLPAPQPAWAQQYDFEMHPVWARKFEPPAISGGESQGVIQSLLQLYLKTGDRKFLKPVPKALNYLRDAQLPYGRLSRFYELETNRPLYFTKKYVLTYDDSDMPTHYSFQVGSRLDRLRQRYRHLEQLTPAELAKLHADETEPATYVLRLPSKHRCGPSSRTWTNAVRGSKQDGYGITETITHTGSSIAVRLPVTSTY